MPTYPLEALRTLRANERDDAARRLAEAVAAHQLASEATARASNALRDHAAATEATLARESTRPLSASAATDALQLRAWRDRRKREADTLRADLERAREAERRASDGVDQARAALATAETEREAIERHHRRWLDEQRRAAEARAEAEAEDRPPRRS